MNTPVGRMSIRARIWGMVALFLLSLIGVSIVDIQTAAQVRMDEKKLKTRHLVETAHSVIQHPTN